MEVTVKFYKQNTAIEKIVEGDNVISIIDDVISQIGGNKKRFKVFCEKNNEDTEDYVIYRDFKKVGALKLTSS